MIDWQLKWRTVIFCCDVRVPSSHRSASNVPSWNFLFRNHIRPPSRPLALLIPLLAMDFSQRFSFLSIQARKQKKRQRCCCFAWRRKFPMRIKCIFYKLGLKIPASLLWRATLAKQEVFFSIGRSRAFQPVSQSDCCLHKHRRKVNLGITVAPFLKLDCVSFICAVVETGLIRFMFGNCW